MFDIITTTLTKAINIIIDVNSGNSTVIYYRNTVLLVLQPIYRVIEK